jgi:hypothetical protein
MLDRKVIHNSAMLKPQIAKKPSTKKAKSGKLKEKGEIDNGLRQRQLHNSKRSTDLS